MHETIGRYQLSMTSDRTEARVEFAHGAGRQAALMVCLLPWAHHLPTLPHEMGVQPTRNPSTGWLKGSAGGAIITIMCHYYVLGFLHG